MARKKSPTPVTPPSVPPQIGINLLNRLIKKGEELLANRPFEDADHTAWENTAQDYLVRAFGSDSQHVWSVMNAGSSVSQIGASERYYEQKRAEDLTNQIKAVRNVIEILELEIELNSPPAEVQEEKVQSKEVFIVHGHNDGLKQTVARLLEKLGLNPTILHELPNQGRTVIEKLHDSSDVGFAVVLLTGDDRGGLRNQPYEEQQPRARQNVIFELGYFLGKLNRHQVCALYEPGVEVPSDYLGVLFIQVDAGGLWKFQLAKELQAAKIPVDMNKIV